MGFVKSSTRRRPLSTIGLTAQGVTTRLKITAFPGGPSKLDVSGCAFDFPPFVAVALLNLVSPTPEIQPPDAGPPLMLLQFRCPAGHALSVPDSLSGRRVRCPKCGKAAQVPDAQPAAAAPGPASAPIPPDMPVATDVPATAEITARPVSAGRSASSGTRPDSDATKPVQRPPAAAAETAAQSQPRQPANGAVTKPRSDDKSSAADSAHRPRIRRAADTPPAGGPDVVGGTGGEIGRRPPPVPKRPPPVPVKSASGSGKPLAENSLPSVAAAGNSPPASPEAAKPAQGDLARPAATSARPTRGRAADRGWPHAAGATPRQSTAAV